MSIQVQSIAASRTTTPDSQSAYVATPLSFVLTLTGSDTFATHEAIFLELHQCREDQEAGELPLAYATTTSPTGTTQTLAFTSAQMNQDFTGEQQEFWVIIYVTGPGDVLLPLYECSLTLRNVHVSLRTDLPDPPDATIAISIAQGDARYAPITDAHLLGVPTAPTAAVSTNTTQIATTAFVLANAGGVSDADKGDITVTASGATWTIDNDVVTNAKAANMATATIKGRTTAGTGDPEDLTTAQTKTLLALENVTNTSDANKPVSTAQQTALNLKANALNGTHTGTTQVETLNASLGADIAGTLNILATTAWSTAVAFSYGAGSAANHRTALGLGTLATQSGTFSGSGTLATGGFTLTVPATGTAALAGTYSNSALNATTIGATTPGTGAFTTLTNSGAATNSAAGAASTPALNVTGAPYTAGSATTNYPLIYANGGTAPTTWSTAGTYLGINAVSGFAGNFMDCHVNGGITIFKVSATTGTVTIGTTTYANNALSFNGDTAFGRASAGVFSGPGLSLSGTLAVTGASTLTGNATLAGALITTPNTLTGAGAISISTTTTGYISTGGGQSLGLADGQNGQIKTIIHTSDGGSGVLTPTTKPSTYTTITFTNVGDAVTLQFITGTGWCIIGIYGAVAA